MVLAFFTGGDSIPLGYKSAVLSFNPVNPYPTASTCATELTLPSKYRDYEQFKKQLDTAFRLHGGLCDRDLHNMITLMVSLDIHFVFFSHAL